MILDIEVPDTIASHFLLLFILLEKNNLKIDDMDHLIFHPGGKNSSNSGRHFQIWAKNMMTTKVLRLYGNMSCMDRLVCFERFMDNRPQKEKR
jgi:predicted naringenin-chalcone synthase